MSQKGRKVPPATPPFDLDAFKQERERVPLGMDEQEIRAYFLKYNGNAGPDDPEIFWRGVHKARTALQSLPMDARQQSKRWLIARGSESLDDGDVPL